MFIGRERELATLNKLYASDKFEFVVIYGRRRVGKTALISQFIDDKNAIYFMGVESNAKQNLENFSKSILSYPYRHGGRNLFPVLSGGFGVCVQAVRKGTDYSCNRRIPLCRPLVEKPRFHHPAFDRPI